MQLTFYYTWYKFGNVEAIYNENMEFNVFFTSKPYFSWNAIGGATSTSHKVGIYAIIKHVMLNSCYVYTIMYRAHH